jgi:integrase
MATIDTRVGPGGKVTYRARTRLKGYPQQTASFPRKTDARKWATGVEAALREGRYLTTNEAKRHTLTELVERYERDILPLKPKAAYNRRQQLGWWKTQLGEYRLSEVTATKIVECRDRLLNTPKPDGKRRSNSTVVRYLAALSHAFSLAVKEWGWVAANPLRNASKPVEPRGRVRFLDNDECSRLLTACRGSGPEALYTIVVLALTTGMRRGEIMGLRWRDVDLDEAHLTLHETKNGERRVVPLVGHALQLLRDRRPGRLDDTELVFPGRTPGRALEFKRPWLKALEHAAICDFRFHDLRHTAASYLAMQGCTTLDLAELLGHKTLQMVKRYSHLSTAHARASLLKLDGAVFPRA